MNSNKINLAIVDGDRLMVQLLSDFLQQQESLCITMIAYSGDSFLKQLEEVEEVPDIVLLELRMKDGNGLEVIEKVTKQYPELKIIVLSSYYKTSSTGYMFKLGVNAFLPKEISPEDLFKIIREVHTKGHYFSSEQIQILRQQISHDTPKQYASTKDTLSTRELEVLELISQQYTTREIAEKLFVSTKTIEAHKSNLLLKTGVRNTPELIIYAIQNQLIDPSDLILLD